MRETHTVIHSAAVLNQKHGDPAFWMTAGAELPSWSNSNEAFSLGLLQHQGLVEIALKTLLPVTTGTLFATPMRLGLDRKVMQKRIACDLCVPFVS